MTQDTPAPDDATCDIEAWIAGATRPETVIMLSSKGREYGQFKALEVELLAAQKAAEDAPSDDRLVSVASTEPRRIAAEMADLAKVIDRGRRPFRLRGLSEVGTPGDTQPDLKTIRAKSKDLDEDAINALTLSACCIEPHLSPEQWTALRGAIGEGQWQVAIRAANKVSFGDTTDAPFSVAASVVLAVDKS